MATDKQFDKWSMALDALKYALKVAEGEEWNLGEKGMADGDPRASVGVIAVRKMRAAIAALSESAGEDGSELREAVQKFQRAYVTTVPGGNKEMDTAMIELLEVVGGFKIKTLSPSAEPTSVIPDGWRLVRDAPPLTTGRAEMPVECDATRELDRARIHGPDARTIDALQSALERVAAAERDFTQVHKNCIAARAEADRLRALTESAIPHGWKAVPREPTEEMLEAQFSKAGPRECFQAMVDAAPQPSPTARPAPSAIATSLRPEVIAFAKAMQLKLDKNAKKKGWPEQDENGDRGWKSCPPMFLEAKLREEVNELLEALLSGDVDAIRYEAADVGNIAMMLADNAGALSPTARADKV